MKYLKLFAPVILSLILVITVKPLLEILFPCLESLTCDLNPISNQALVYTMYGLLTGEQTRLLIQLGVFALIGLAISKRRLLLWNFVLYVSIAFAYSGWVMSGLYTKSEYGVPEVVVAFMLKAIILYGMMFTLDALVFSISGDSIPPLQKIREKISRVPAWQSLVVMAAANVVVVWPW